MHLHLFLAAQLLIAGVSPSPLDSRPGKHMVASAARSSQLRETPSISSSTLAITSSGHHNIEHPTSQTRTLGTARASILPTATTESYLNPTPSSTLSSDWGHESKYPNTTPNKADQSAIGNITTSHSISVVKSTSDDPTPSSKKQTYKVKPVHSQPTLTLSISKLAANSENPKDNQLVATKSITKPGVTLALSNPGDKRYGNELGPQFFYESPPSVKCWPIDTIISGGGRAPGSWPKLPPRKGVDAKRYEASRPDFKRLIRLRGRKVVRGDVAKTLRKCHLCLCDPNNPEMGIYPQVYTTKLPPINCADYQAAKCKHWYGCVCWTDLGQPRPTTTGEPDHGEWQRAINRIPQLVRQQNPDWMWQHYAEAVGFPEITFPLGYSAEADEMDAEGEDDDMWAPVAEQPLLLLGPDQLEPQGETADEHTAQVESSTNQLERLHISSSSGGFHSPGGQWGGDSSGSSPQGGFGGFHGGWGWGDGGSGGGAGAVRRRAASEKQSSTTDTSYSRAQPPKGPYQLSKNQPPEPPTKTSNLPSQTCLQWADVPSFPKAATRLSIGEIYSQEHYDMLIWLCNRDCGCALSPKDPQKQYYDCKAPPKSLPPGTEPLILYCAEICFCGKP
ncbi:hypothetical protein TWF506_004881 [Arthrobotrys conoides]|uniref:Uncharacterized protein n=1 Tax=Arthrobotrys conoides TaxID=74498 RepID=A0AAN8ND94_9PEZI